MQFVVVDRGEEVLPLGAPVVELQRDRWDDFGWQTLFHATLVLPPERVVLGPVKIMARGQDGGPTPLPEAFTRLGEEFCSVGQDPDYYANVTRLPRVRTVAILRGLRDAAYGPGIRDAFAGTEGWQRSLLRFGQAESAMLFAASRFTGVLARQASFALEIPGGPTLPFAFDHDAEVPGRLNVVVGYNGVGKTRLLADIAVAASRFGVEDHVGARLTGETQVFGSVVAVSYSAFDDFETPRVAEHGSTGSFGYHFCGLRRIAGGADRLRLKDADELFDEFAYALADARARGPALAEALSMLESEPSFGRIGVAPSGLANGDLSPDVFRTLSTGHKIVLHIVAQLAAYLRPQALALVDEPESHLHPPLLAALLKAVLALLDANDAYGIVATHSPVVLQEVPAQHVRVLERYGAVMDVRPPAIQTFGESIGAITRDVFSLDSSATDYQGVLRRLAETYALEELEEMFGELSAQARALVMRYQHARES